MVSEEQKRSSPRNQKNPLTEGNGQNTDTLFSPRFKTAAVLAGWDEEALLLASLVVEDTPDRDCRLKKRSVLNSKSPPTNSRRKRRAQRSQHSIPVAALDLDEEDTPKRDSGKKKKEKKTCAIEGTQGTRVEGSELKGKSSGVSYSTSALPCIDKLREELSCAICLEICFEPSTTPCGHSFCRKCLRSAADKCGKKCPKCRQLLSNGRSCTINTVLWNTIQLLFPQEVEARKAASALNDRRASAPGIIPETAFYTNLRNQSIQGASSRGMSTRRSGMMTIQDDDDALVRRFQREIDGQRRGTRVGNNSRNETSSSSSSSSIRGRTRRGITIQDEDAALALRLQRGEFMQAFRGTSQEQTSGPSNLSLARANLRAMTLRVRDRRI